LPIARAFLVLIAFAVPAVADDWDVLVVGNPSRSAPTAFADSHAAAAAFEKLALGPVALKREIGADALAEALDDLVGAPRVLIYFAGPIGTGASGPLLMGQGGGDPRGAINPLLDRLAASGTTEAVLLIEDCAGGAGFAGRLAVPEVPTGMAVFMAASAGPDGACPEAPDRVTDRLARLAGATLQDGLAGVWTGADSLAPLAIGRVQNPDLGSEGAAEIAVVSGDVIEIAPVAILAAAPTEVISGIAVEAEVEPALGVGTSGAVPTAEPAVFRPLRDEDILALPVAAGMPEPSIIVGIIRTGDVETPPETDIAYDDFEGREALRTADPVQFQALVEGGRLDPPPEALVLALQTELKRAGCYRNTLDGQWGGGSRRAVERFFEAAKQPASGQEPDPSLYRQILLAGPVTCPEPVAEETPARTSTRRTTEPAAVVAKPPPAAKPDPKPKPPPKSDLSNSALGGVFR
jgi:hypothetical protein